MTVAVVFVVERADVRTKGCGDASAPGDKSSNGSMGILLIIAINVMLRN